MVLLMMGNSLVVFGEDLMPIMKTDGKYRIAYLENDPYFNYAGTFYGVICGLRGAGWIVSAEHMPYKLGDDDTRPMYEWLTSEMDSDFLEFPEDGYYQLINMDESAQEQFIKRFNDTKDFDLLLVMGTKAGKFASKHITNIPVMVMSTSNAVGAGIVTSTEESGRDNLWAHVDPERYYRQLSVFHDIFGFNKLGIVYEDSSSGRVVAAVDTVEAFAKEWDVEIVRYYVNEAIDEVDKLRYDRELMAAYNKIANEVDAFYLTPGSRETTRLIDYMKPFYDQKIPVFSQVGPLEVSYGALLSVYRFDYDEVGFFGSDRLIRILKGRSAGSLTQKFGETPSIFLNLAVAEKIRYKIPLNILLISDRIFTDIESEEVK